MTPLGKYPAVAAADEAQAAAVARLDSLLKDYNTLAARLDEIESRKRKGHATAAELEELRDNNPRLHELSDELDIARAAKRESEDAAKSIRQRTAREARQSREVQSALNAAKEKVAAVTRELLQAQDAAIELQNQLIQAGICSFRGNFGDTPTIGLTITGDEVGTRNAIAEALKRLEQ